MVPRPTEPSDDHFLSAVTLHLATVPGPIGEGTRHLSVVLISLFHLRVEELGGCRFLLHVFACLYLYCISCCTWTSSLSHFIPYSNAQNKSEGTGALCNLISVWDEQHTFNIIFQPFGCTPGPRNRVTKTGDPTGAGHGPVRLLDGIRHPSGCPLAFWNTLWLMVI